MRRALDLFCGAGGVSEGLAQAGFEVTGVDINYQPRYPFEFIHADALRVGLEGYDLIWASPPCQQHSVTQRIWGNQYQDLIEPIRERLEASGALYVIENVEGAPLLNPVLLCGNMFLNLQVYRHRLFESNFSIVEPPHQPHKARTTQVGHRRQQGEFMTVAGHIASLDDARAAMGIDWMNRDELCEAIPPAYAEYIGYYARLALGDESRLSRRAVPKGMEQRLWLTA